MRGPPPYPGITIERPLRGPKALCAFGVWDGIPPVRKPYAEIEAQHASDREFVKQIEDQLPDGVMTSVTRRDSAGWSPIRMLRTSRSWAP